MWDKPFPKAASAALVLWGVKLHFWGQWVSSIWLHRGPDCSNRGRSLLTNSDASLRLTHHFNIKTISKNPPKGVAQLWI